MNVFHTRIQSGICTTLSDHFSRSLFPTVLRSLFPTVLHNLDESLSEFVTPAELRGRERERARARARESARARERK